MCGRRPLVQGKLKDGEQTPHSISGGHASAGMRQSSVRQRSHVAPPWLHIAQLAAVLRAVHTSGLALRPACLHPTKVRRAAAGRMCAQSMLLL